MNKLVKKFTVYWGQKETVYDACHGTWEIDEVRQLKLLYEGGKPQSGGPSFLGELTPLDTIP